VKQIVENHGGNITFESLENQGTTFKILMKADNNNNLD
jgi:signal transduction histidine kinase